MASASIKFVVSFSSQDEIHKVQNLINGNGCQKWLSNNKDKTGHTEAIFQLEDFLNIASIDVGTIWCSTIEIQVGRSDWPQDKPYLTLCPTSSLMTPIDCRLKNNINKTRIFSTEEFIDTVVREKWDRIKLILRQPYRKDVQFGLSFIKIQSALLNIEKTKSGLSPLDDNRRVKMIKSHFFGSNIDREPEERILKEKLLKLSSTGENGSSELTRTAKLVLAASETTNRIYSPSNRSKENSMTARRGLFSESINQKSAPKLKDEIVKFLFDQKLTPKDLDVVTVADLRHKLEKMQKRKLNSEEKKIFMNYCQSYLVEILDGSIVSGSNSGLDKSQRGGNCPTLNSGISSNLTDQRTSSRHQRRSSTSSFDQNGVNILNIDSPSPRNSTNLSIATVNSSSTNVSKRNNSSSAKFQQSSKSRSTEDNSIERLLSENSQLLKSASKSSKSAVTNLESENVNFGDFDICDISDTDNDMEEISGSNCEFTASNSAQNRILKTQNKECIKSQMKNCVDASSSKKLVMVNQNKAVIPSFSCSANGGSINTPLKSGKDLELMDSTHFKSNRSTPKSTVLSGMAHSDSKIKQSSKSDNFPSTSKTPSSARKRKRSESDVYIYGGQTLVGSDKKVRGRGRVGSKGRGLHDIDSEMNESGSKKGRGRGRSRGRGRGRKSSQDSPILLTDDVWLNIGGGQVLGSTPESESDNREEAVSRLLPCSICNVKIKDYLLDHHFIQCSARFLSSQIEIPPLPDLAPNLSARKTTGGRGKRSKNSSGCRNTVTSQTLSTSQSLEARNSNSSQTSLSADIYKYNSDSIVNGASNDEHNSLGSKNVTSQLNSESSNRGGNSFTVSPSPVIEDVLVSDSEDDLELLIPTLQDVLVQCPICSEMFPSEMINVHTNACLDMD